MTADFTLDMLTEVMKQACHIAGLDPEGAELLRLGENAIYGLASGHVVLRIARGPERLPVVEKELCVATWLKASDVATVEAYPGVRQPILVSGYPVSWQCAAMVSLKDQPETIRGGADYGGSVVGVELAVLHALDEGVPFGGGEDEGRPCGIFAVADASAPPGQLSHLDTVAAITARIG